MLLLTCCSCSRDAGSGAYQTDGTARAGGAGGYGGVYVLEYANANGIGDLIFWRALYVMNNVVEAAESAVLAGRVVVSRPAAAALLPQGPRRLLRSTGRRPAAAAAAHAVAS